MLIVHTTECSLLVQPNGREFKFRLGHFIISVDLHTRDIRIKKRRMSSITNLQNDSYLYPPLTHIV